jgi:hypothetical protein
MTVRRTFWTQVPRLLAGTGLLACLFAGATQVQAAGAHEHGVMRLDVAVEGNRVRVELDSPLHNLLGFERAPRTDAERQNTELALKKLRDGAALFRIDGKAGCTLGKVDLRSAPLQLGQAAKPAAGDHGDLEGSYEFNCSAGAQAAFLEVGLFEAFPQVKRIDLQVATPKGQLKATLRRPSTRVVLVR